MIDVSALEWIKSAVVPVLTAATTISLFWLKLYSDSRKKLDDLLIELEHAIHIPVEETRTEIFRRSYLEIRKAATEYDRWILDPNKKKELAHALRAFRGQRHGDADVFSLRGSPHEGLIDTFLTGNEVRCLPPPDSDYTGYMDRIAALRKITGSRRWKVPDEKAI